MEKLLEVSAQFPSVIFTTLLGVVVIYWLVGMLGLIDLDFAGDVDLELDADIDANISVGGLTGFLLTFGLTGVPFTLVISIMALICWLISVYFQFYLLTWLPSGWLYYLLGSASDVAIFFISLPITAIIIRPLKGMFNSVEAALSSQLIGLSATIATHSVSTTFGQARVFNEGAELLLDVRCDPQHTFTMGDKVLVIEYSPENHTYIVAPCIP